jgi:hypothetical protein
MVQQVDVYQEVHGGGLEKSGDRYPSLPTNMRRSLGEVLMSVTLSID